MLPDEHLARILPANDKLAKRLWERSLSFADDGKEFRPSQKTYPSVTMMESPHPKFRCTRLLKGYIKDLPG